MRLIASRRTHVAESQTQSGPGPKQIDHFLPLVNGILLARKDGPHGFPVTIVLQEVFFLLSGRLCQTLQ